MKTVPSWLCIASVFGFACTGPEEPMADCVPSETAWNEVVRDVVMENCGICHGEEPDFGAPFTLLDYASITAGTEGERIVDEMHRQLAAGSMPPPGVRRPTIASANTIADWASCGEVEIVNTTNASRLPFASPTGAPEGLEAIDLLADEIPIGADVLDNYQNIDFSNLTAEDVFIRRFEAVIDASQVVHHLTLRRGDPADDASMKYLYAWAPGTGAIEFPDGGVRLRPGDNLRLQIHYNNGAGALDVRDSSGVRLYIAPAQGREYAMTAPGPGAFGFSIPPRTADTVESTCEITESVRAIAAMPHMHETGASFDLLLETGGEAAVSILELSSWSFETQLFYDLPIDLARGDQLTVRCEFRNNTDSVVVAGPRTADEMCFAFMYVTPPPRNVLCVPGGVSEVTMLEYEPGLCIAEPLSTLPLMGADIMEGAPIFDETGTMPDGHFVLERFIISTPEPGFVSLATITGSAQLDRRDGTVGFDGAFHFIAPTEELRNGVQSELQVSGTLVSPNGPSLLDVTCTEAGSSDGTTFGTVGGAPAAMIDLGEMPVPLVAWFIFAEAT